MQKETGQISIHAANMMPIIKKWLYSDRDIFIRELISNAWDATRKREVIEGAQPDKRIDVAIDTKVGTLTVTDSGVGMTDDEVRKYINQVAFSGAQEFMERYEHEEQIIGHFGLGFYSAFMVAKSIIIDTRSCLQDASAVRWLSEGGLEYEMEASERTQVGTSVILTIADDAKDFLDGFTLRETLRKYCAFMPAPIYLTVDGKADETPINDTTPLYTKPPRECTPEEYNAFYKSTFSQWEDPLFYIHLNVDYPFNLKGILYFPKLKADLREEGTIKLYANQVFVADNIKEIVPEFLLLLKGVIDCPDIPLNVSRSFLQNDGSVKRLSAHIVRKVSDKLSELFEQDREAFEGYWDDIQPFIKYGCLRDEGFFEKVADVLLFKKHGGGYVTYKEYQRSIGLDPEQDEKDQKEFDILYASDGQRQASTIELLEQGGANVVLLESPLDTPFMQLMESKKKVHFLRVDAKLHTGVSDAEADGQADKVIELFKGAIGENEHVKIEAKTLSTDSVPALLLSDENIRRYRDASRIWGSQGFEMPQEQTLVINLAHPVVKKLQAGETPEERAKEICRHIFDLAELSQQPLEAQRMTDFIKRSGELLAFIV